MEELNKTQILLLTLMVSFVTSIATGIITVALMDEQAPAGVTQTVNRVVERTIEKVVPEKGQSAGAVTKEVIVREENLITESIDNVSKSLVRIKSRVIDANGASATISLGLIINNDGILVADAKSITNGISYRGVYPDGKEVNVKPLAFEGGLVLLKPETLVSSVTSAKLADSNDVKMGQTAIMLYGQDRNVVSLGIISAGRKGEAGAYESFDSNLATSDIYGNPVFNLRGEIVGLQLPGETGVYITASNLIARLLEKGLSL